MIYVGMDVSSKEFMVHAINEKKEAVFEGAIRPNREGLRKLMKDLGKETKLVVFEAGNQMKWIALFLKKMAGVIVHVVHPNEVKWITESGGKKTDKVDAKKLAHLARGDMLPRPVHIVEGSIRELRELLSARDQLQSKRVALINTMRALMKQEGYRLPEKFFQRADWQERLEKLKVGTAQRLILKSFRESVEALLKSEQEITERVLEINDKRIELLKSIPGIGEIASRVLVSAIDEVDRFDNRKSLANYGALTPTVYQSGDVTNHGRINRDGRHEVRKVLLQCAHTIERMKSYESRPIREFYRKIEKRRGKKRAVVAVARKLLVVAYGVMKSGTPYDPRRLVAYAA